MTDKHIVDLFAETFGGSVKEKPPRGLGKKMQYRWRVFSNQAWDVYYEMRPYLRIKIWKGEPN